MRPAADGLKVAWAIVVALRANAEVTNEDCVAMARNFAEQHFVAKGLPVHLDVQAPNPELGSAGREAEN
jgi:hypothetical protein